MGYIIEVDVAHYYAMWGAIEYEILTLEMMEQPLTDWEVQRLKELRELREIVDKAEYNYKNDTNDETNNLPGDEVAQ